nr:MAG TPA: hypothetical protein [Caudoviricetes sp.]
MITQIISKNKEILFLSDSHECPIYAALQSL